MFMFENRFYSIGEVAKALGVTRVAVYAWRRQGEFPWGVQFGSARRYSGKELNEWLKARYEAEANEAGI